MAGPEAFEEETSHSRDVDQLTQAIPFPLPHLLLIQTTLPIANAKGMLANCRRQ